MNHEEIMIIVALNLKRRWSDQIYVITVMNTHLLVELQTNTGEGDGDAAKRADERNKGVILENFASFTNCISNTNDNQIDNKW